MWLLTLIDRYLNKITMYRLVLYGLAILAALGIGFSATGALSLSLTGLVISLTIVLSVGYVANKILAKVLSIPANVESGLITALILFCVMPPATTTTRAGGIAIATIVAIASKFLLAYHRKHIFNPAAFGAVVAGLTGFASSFWWVGSAVMLPFTLVFTLLIVRKIRRYALVGSFAVASLLMAAFVGQTNGALPGEVLTQLIVSSPLIFLAGVMLTEPSTTPPQRYNQVLYGALVGVLFASQAHIGDFFISPETALIIGNVFAYIVSPKQKWLLRLKERQQLSPRVYNLVFTPDKPINFTPGQYMEWTLPHTTPDSRGNRRSFSIASSPTEKNVILGIKTYNPSSSYKKALLGLRPGDSLVAGQVSGNFVLPDEAQKRLVFIAGGIGITPFRSMLQYLIDTNQKRDITLFYIVSSPDEVSYREVLAAATKTVGLRVVMLLTSNDTPKNWPGHIGSLSFELLENEVPHGQEAHYYISGPDGMVRNYRKLLRTSGVPSRQITTDYFSGY